MCKGQYIRLNLFQQFDFFAKSNFKVFIRPDSTESVDISCMMPHQQYSGTNIVNQINYYYDQVSRYLRMIKQPLNRSTANPSNEEPQYKSMFYLMCITLNACLSSFFFGYSLVYLSTISYSSVQTIYNYSSQSEQSSSVLKGIVMGCIPVGAAVGAVFSFIYIKKVSPKTAFLITNAISILAIATIQIKTLYTLLAGRIIQGICVGLYSTITPIYINQMLPASLSRMGALHQAVIAFGQSFAFLFAYLLSFQFEQDQTYVYISSLLFVTLILQSVLFITVFNFNPPKYLFEAGQRQKALDVLQKIYKDDQIPAILQKNKMSVSSDLIDSFSNDSIEPKLKKTVGNTWIAIFAAIHIPLAKQFTGINAVVTYGVQIVNEILPEYKQIVPIVINFQPAIAALLTTLLLTRLGRKTVMQMGCLSIAFILGLCALGFLIKQTNKSFSQFVIIGALILYMFIFGLTLGSVVWLYIPEFATQSIMPFSTLANWVGASIVIIIFPIVKQMLPQKNPGYLMLIFLVYMLICIPINAKVLIQTKGRPRQQVMQQYQKSASI